MSCTGLSRHSNTTPSHRQSGPWRRLGHSRGGLVRRSRSRSRILWFALQAAVPVSSRNGKGSHQWGGTHCSRTFHLGIAYIASRRGQSTRPLRMQRGSGRLGMSTLPCRSCNGSCSNCRECTAPSSRAHGLWARRSGGGRGCRGWSLCRRERWESRS